MHHAPPLLAEHTLEADGGHQLHVAEYGHPQGRPVLLLHGGPGSGQSPLLRSFFAPGAWRIVAPDQRGAGASRPVGATTHNTTAHLLADLRALRRRLGLARWAVVGGSWGATLALAHALDEPEAVSALLLRAVFLARPQDIDGFFHHAAARHPHEHAELRASVAPHPLDAAALGAALAGPQATRCARAWWAWERALAGAPAATEPPPDAALLARYRVQAHYLAHGCWLQAPPLLARCAALPRVPTLLLHGRDDRICPPDGAQALAEAVPWLDLRWVPGAGHDPGHPAMGQAMREALAGLLT